MKVAGFSIARNVIKYDYPIREAILSVLPLVDKFYVAVGDSEDGTRNYIQSLNSEKLIIIDTVWDDELRKGGLVLSSETNKAFDAIDRDFDWAFYIQGDEVVHEKFYPQIKKAMNDWQNDDEVQGILFDYIHFYGSYQYVGNSRKWYRNEIRIIKNDKKIRSYKDAQGFRTIDDQKLSVKKIDAEIYHYGWVKPPKIQQDKQKRFHKMWHNDKWVTENIGRQDDFDYSRIDSLINFRGTHPKLMEERIKSQNWIFDYDPERKNFSFKNRILYHLEKLTGWRPGEYKNYRIIK